MKRTESTVGRPGIEKPLPAFYDSMQACAADLGIPLSVLKKAKASGCDAFRSTRVYARPLLRWIFSQDGDESGLNWNEELAKEKTKRERIKRLRDEKAVIDKSAARQGIQGGVSIMFTMLERLFLSEAPAGLKGKLENEIHTWGMERIEEMRKTLAAKFASIGEEEP